MSPAPVKIRPRDPILVAQEQAGTAVAAAPGEGTATGVAAAVEIWTGFARPVAAASSLSAWTFTPALRGLYSLRASL